MSASDTSQARNDSRGRHSTVEAHMSPAPLAVQGWDAPRLLDWATRIGPPARALINGLLHPRRPPQQSYRRCLGILRLGKSYGDDRLEAACERALAIGATSYSSLKSILKNGLDTQRLTPPCDPAQTSLPREHANVRGATYDH